MVKFDFLDKFIAQKDKRDLEQAELARREDSALEEVHALKAEYEKVLRESFVKRRDATAELDALQERIEAAQRNHVRRQQEKALYSQVVKPEITEMQVVDAFNKEFIPEFKEKRLGPVLDRLLAAKQEFFDAAMEYYGVMDEFDRELASSRTVLGGWGTTYYYKFNELNPPIKHYFVTLENLRAIESKNRPDFKPERMAF